MKKKVFTELDVFMKKGTWVHLIIIKLGFV